MSDNKLHVLRGLSWHGLTLGTVKQSVLRPFTAIWALCAQRGS